MENKIVKLLKKAFKVEKEAEGQGINGSVSRFLLLETGEIISIHIDYYPDDEEIEEVFGGD